MTDEITTKLTDVAKSLNHADDAHWTKAGLPDCNVLSELSGIKVTRAMADAALPGLIRQPPDGNQPKPQKTQAGQTEQVPNGNRSVSTGSLGLGWR